MADPVDTPMAAAPAPAAAIPRARSFAGDQAIAHVLRMGAIFSGLCFVGSLGAELLPVSAWQMHAIDALRRAGIALLIVTPVLRLVAAGVLLALKGEWRYAFYAACILLLLAAAVGAGMTV